MHFLGILRILGLLLAVFSLIMVPPAVMAWWLDDGTLRAFGLSFAVILALGVALALPALRAQPELRLRDGFIVVALFWLGLGLAGALPLVLVADPALSFTDAAFESISGLTTTGSTVLTGLDAMPPALLFYRQLLQWLGGMGIIVLAVAILPMLGIGGMQLYRAEMPGPMKEEKLTPRITETAKALWYIYLGLTLACALAYWLAGMSVFDAVSHSFTTVATAGYSTHDASMGYFDDPLIEAIAVVFMVLGGINFALHFRVLSSGSPRLYAADSEARTYLALLAALTAVAALYLYASAAYPSATEALRHALFQSVSIATTTGYTTTGYAHWPGLLPVLLLFASFVGGCGGSTAGGMKVIRALLLAKQGMREILRLVHPRAQVPVKVGRVVMPQRVVDAVWGFFATYVALFALIMLAVMATGVDQVTAFSAVAACMNNLGPGLGDVAAHFGALPETAKWLLSVAMLLGRLEVFTVLVILSPAFWRG